MNLREAFLTMLGTGYIKRAPGTFGSLFALVPALPILYFSAFTLFLLAIFVGVVAIKQVNIYEQNSRTHDARHIVIDELVGMWIALSIAWGGAFGGVGLESVGSARLENVGVTAAHESRGESLAMAHGESIAAAGESGGKSLALGGSSGESLAATSAKNHATTAGFAPSAPLFVPRSALLVIALSFAFFRLYDVWKPSIIGRVDRSVGGGLGVVGDDALAGLFAGLSALIVMGILGRFLA